MSNTVLKRIGQALLVLLLAYTLAFFLLSALPSDGVAARYADPALGLSQAEIEEIREQMGVDKPLLEQYLATLAGLFTGNLGFSVASGTPVFDLIVDAAHVCAGGDLDRPCHHRRAADRLRGHAAGRWCGA